MKGRYFAAAIIFILSVACQGKSQVQSFAEPVDYVNILMGTMSEFALSNGNTYPAVAVPWGNEFLDTTDTWNRGGRMAICLHR